MWGLNTCTGGRVEQRPTVFKRWRDLLNRLVWSGGERDRETEGERERVRKGERDRERNRKRDRYVDKYRMGG